MAWNGKRVHGAHHTSPFSSKRDKPKWMKQKEAKRAARKQRRKAAKRAAASKQQPVAETAPAKSSWRPEFLNGFIVLWFGKHKGQSVDTVPDDYLRWLVENSTSAAIAKLARKELGRREQYGNPKTKTYGTVGCKTLPIDLYPWLAPWEEPTLADMERARKETLS